ncbi:hypothetical protein F444_22450 [Phytophthora nicotianae P1976]|uniref:Uncharacterized protein n=1 Tax=Phytophthora nicotianae P1976 TaxID=1317066 RepID=A0A080YXR0_PHYNI|nr:hypothetical protein F444_22450 [Phytophthora nicotianae P1976]
MYADAQWASDVNNTISVSKRATQDSGDQTEDGFLKKQPVAKSSTGETSTDSQEVPEVNTEIPDERPQVESQSQTDGSASRLSDRSTPKPNLEEEELHKSSKTEEFIAKRWIQNLYKSNPNWIALRFNPIKTNTTRDMKRYIGKNGELYRVSTGKPSKSKYIDWVLTAEDLMNIRSDGESNSIDEVSLMRMEDATIPYQNITGNKRRDEFPSQRMGKVHIRPTWFHDSSSSTTADEKQAKSKILFMLKAYKKKLIGSNIVIRPVLKDGEVLNKYELITDSKGDLNVRNQETKRNKQSRLSEISWQSTLALFSETVKSRGLTFEFEPSPDTVLDSDPNRFKPTQGIWYKGKLSGSDVMEDLSIPETEAKAIISDYFIEAGKSDSIFPIHLLPLTIGKANKNTISARLTVIYE